MPWTTFYNPPEPSIWQGRADAVPNAFFFQCIKPLHILEEEAPVLSPAFALLGFCCDEGVRRNFGRVGAALGPPAIRQALAPLAIPLATPEACWPIYDAGDIFCRDHNLEAAQAALGEAVQHLLQKQLTPIVLGGGHEVAFGHYLGLSQTHADDLHIVNFDAHLDMRPLLTKETKEANDCGSSGTPFLQIAQHLEKQEKPKPFHYHCIGLQPSGNSPQLLQTAIQYQVNMLFAENLQGPEKQQNIDAFLNFLHAPLQTIYMSICLDVFASAYAPGVSAPQPLGLTPWQVIPIMRRIIASGKVKSYDIAELSPPLDIDHRTAKLAANLIYEIIRQHIVSVSSIGKQHE